MKKAHVLLILLVLGIPALGQAPRKIESILETYDLKTNQRTVVYREQVRFEAPNWTRDKKSLLINKQGRLYRIPVKGGTPVEIDTDFAKQLNNDHGLSPDGKMLAISHNNRQIAPSENSTIYVVPAAGGVPRQITKLVPSYWHGWSPDGKTLAYTAKRQGDYDIYAIPVAGGEEQRLTTAPGLDDGPDYSPDGKYIYFNSVRTGKMQIWRMNANGGGETQITNDEYNNWFPHPSPDGKWIVFLSYIDPVEPSAHPADKNVMLRLLEVKTGKVRELCRLFGGQGTINVPSWSPDSRRFAFVSYRQISE